MKYPNATEIDGQGVWNIPYIINPNDADHYPLMTQFVIPEFPIFFVVPLFMISTLVIIVCRRRYLP
jgi:hypothetical protein